MTFSGRRLRPWQRSGLVILVVCGVVLAPQAAFAADGGAAGHRSAAGNHGGRIHATAATPPRSARPAVKRHRAVQSPAPATSTAASTTASTTASTATLRASPDGGQRPDRQPRQRRDRRTAPSLLGHASPLDASPWNASPLNVVKGTGPGGHGPSAGGPVMVNCALPQAERPTESPTATVSAAWTDSSIRDHVATTLSITLHKEFTCNSLVGRGFQVTLPTTLYVTTGTPTSTCSGTLTAGIGTNMISLSNATLGSAAGDCVVQVPVAGYSSGTYTLTAASFSNLTGLSNAVTEQSLTVTAGPLGMYGYFGTSPIDALGSSGLNLVLYRTDQNRTLAVTGVGFRLALPPGLTVAGGTPTNTCGGTLTAVHGTTAAVVAGAGLSAGAAICTIGLNVTAARAGSYGLQAATVTNAAGVSSSLGDYCLTGVSAPRIETGCAPALRVDPLAQTITFAQPADASVSKHTAVLTATATSSLTVTFTSATPQTCSVTAATVRLLIPGTCTIDAHQAGDGTYAVAPVQSRSLLIGPPTEPPRSVTAMAGVASITAHWSAPLDLTGVTGYTAVASPGPATCSTDGALSCVMGGTAGVRYTISVIARNSLGDSAAAGPSNGVTPTGPPISNTIPATDLDLTTDRGLITTAEPSQDIVVIGTGFAAYSTATIVIYSAPLVLGTVTTDGHGNFRKPVKIPAHLATGRHTMIAAGVGPNGAPHYLSLHVRVRAGGAAGGLSSLARTGAPITAFILMGAASLLSGGGMIVAGRPRRRRPLGRTASADCRASLHGAG